MNELTNKTKVVVSKIGDFWVSDQHAASLTQLMQNNPQDSVELEGNTISIRSIDGILTAEAYDLMQKKKQGAYQCKWQYWHDRFEKCNHAEAMRYRK